MNPVQASGRSVLRQYAPRHFPLQIPQRRNQHGSIRQASLLYLAAGLKLLYSVFGLCPCQHNGTYTRNVHPATPTKKSAQILRFAESKKEPLSRKILGKAAQNALGKGTGPSNLPNTAVGIFLSRLKKWAQINPEVVLFPLTGTQTVTPIEGAELSAPSFCFSCYAGN